MANVDKIIIKEEYSLKNHTTMQLPCTAKFFVIAEDYDSLKQAVTFAVDNNFPILTIGGGSNIIFTMDYYNGLVIRLGGDFDSISQMNENEIEVGAGLSLSKLLNHCKINGLGGLEFLAGIPGTIGGSIMGNAGAGGWGLCDFVEAVSGIDFDGNLVVLKKGEFQYDYRYTSIKNMIICSAIMRLEPTPRKTIDENIKKYMLKRQHQPAGVKSAGCIFKNIKIISAGKLIDDAGLKGYRIGGAVVSDKHANFIINDGTASAQDVLDIIEHIRRIIYSKYQYKLQLEVELV